MTTKRALSVLACTLCCAGSLFAQSSPISGSERVRWTVQSTVGAGSLATGVFSSAWNTANNLPEEYGPHFSGLAKRYGMRLTGVAASNSLEAGLGAMWNEDPRYFPSDEDGFVQRVKHAGRMTILARRADNSLAPAYARFVAVPASNFISNSWRVKSENSVGDALVRTAMGFAGRFVGNAIRELWAPARRH